MRIISDVEYFTCGIHQVWNIAGVEYIWCGNICGVGIDQVWNISGVDCGIYQVWNIFCVEYIRYTSGVEYFRSGIRQVWNILDVEYISFGIYIGCGVY